MEYDGNGTENRRPESGGPRKGLILTLALIVVGLIAASVVFLLIEVKKYRKDPAGAETKDSVTEAAVYVDPVIGTVDLPVKETGEAGEKTEVLTYVIDVSDVVERVMPSVVAIVDELESSYRDPVEYFFGGGGSGKQYSTASGSGVIVDERNGELLIVTNNHVVSNEDATTKSRGLRVTFADGTQAEAQIKGTDEQSDLAIVSVRISDLSPDTQKNILKAKIGDSDSVKVGAGVIVIGNAGGYGQSVTSGIVSALEREVTIDGITRKLIQTDAAINPGNSGGGMFNSNGELIGISNAKTVSTNIEGMGFAIPITPVRSIIEELMNRETIPEEDQGWLGIQGETVSEDYVTENNYPQGVIVTKITKNSPAEKAGLALRDIITEVNGTAVTTIQGLRNTINSYRAGTVITLKVYRPKKGTFGISFEELSIKVTLGRYSELETD